MSKKRGKPYASFSAEEFTELVDDLRLIQDEIKEEREKGILALEIQEVELQKVNECLQRKGARGDVYRSLQTVCR